MCCCLFFFFSSRRRHTRCSRDWSSDVCSSDLVHVHPQRPQTDAGALRFLGQDYVVGERGFPTTAELLGHLDADESEFSRAAVEVAGRRTSFLPRRVVGHHLLDQELANCITKCIVFGGEDRAAHWWSSLRARKAVRLSRRWLSLRRTRRQSAF